MIGGMIVGVLSLIVMAVAPSVLLLGAGWILAQWGWGTVLGNLQNSTADRLPEAQRGKVAGLTGFATQVAPVIGVIATMGAHRQRPAPLPRPRSRRRRARHPLRDPRARG